MHLAPLIRDLAVILAVAGIVTLVFQRIRQPVVLGYIIAGLIVGPYTPPFPLVSDLPNIRTLAELGVIFLMFSLGLEFSFRKLARVGSSAGLTALFEVVFMIGAGYATGRLLGWGVTDSLFLGAMLSISSTTIIIKALDELGLKTRRFAERIFAILIVEDLLAILILVALTTFAASGAISGTALAQASGKLALVVGSWFLAGYFLVPRFVGYVGRFRSSDETLVIVCLALCLGLSVAAAQFHYSTALGAFIMGSILAESTESHRIEDLIRPLRDLFAAIFFVSIGMLIDPWAIWENRGAIALISLVTIVGKILSTALAALVTGQTFKTSVLVGFGLAQIGEFSFIIGGLGLSMRVMSESLYPVAVAVSIVTTFGTPYLIRSALPVAEWLERRLPARILAPIARYAEWSERQAARRNPSPSGRAAVARWVTAAFTVTVASVLIAEHAAPLIAARIPDPDVAAGVTWAVSIVVTAPFLWAMLTAFRGASRTGAVLSQIFTLLLLGVFSLFYFKAKYVGGVVALVSLGLFGRLYRQLETSYRWFEEGFLAAFREHGKSHGSRDIHRSLAPWDGHLVRIKVHADSGLAGMNLQDAAIRRRMGLNVVAIQRGSRTIVAPRPDQQIFPKDEILVLGTDEQIEKARKEIEAPPGGSDAPAAIEGYELRKVYVGPSSRLVGLTIRRSGLRESYGVMVVGVERGGKRIMNPDSDLAIEADDVLSLVGESPSLDALAHELTHSETSAEL